MIGKRLVVFLTVMGCLVAGGRFALGAFAQSQQAAGAAYDVAVPHDAPIPKAALRLRIIANSDSNSDQSVKLSVRDAVVVQVANLVKGAKDADEARTRVLKALPQIRQTAVEVTRKRGYDYPVKVDVGQVPFPTKVYGNQVYPAGTYEALRITLGSGSGQNWWCVLFPPLCFVDIADGDAVPNTAGFPDLPPLETIGVQGTDGQQHQVQVRMAAADYGEELWQSLRHWWGA